VALYHKYRPQNFSDVIGQDHVSLTLLEAIKSSSLSHAYLLTGPRGTGKTTTARLLAKAFCCQKIEENGRGEPCNTCDRCLEIAAGKALDVIEIDAASHTSVDDVRDIIDKARLAPAVSKKKVYIIDEIHMLSKSAFNALLKTLEEPPSHVVFIMATTEVQKVPATILSRAQRYDFKRVSHGDIVKYLKRVAEGEAIKITDGALDLIARAAQGGHRDAISLFEQVASRTKDIGVADVESVLGVVRGEEVDSFLWTIFNGLPEEGLKIVHRLYESGAEMTVFNRQVIEGLRRVLHYLIGGQSILNESKEGLEKISKIAATVSVERVVAALEIFIEKGRALKDVSIPTLPLEMAVVQIAAKVEGGEASKSGETRAEARPVASTTKAAADTLQAKPAEKKEDREENGSSLIPESKDAGLKDAVESPKTEPNESNKASIPTDDPKKVMDSAAATAPVLEMTDDIWQSIIDQTKKENGTLAALLRDAQPLSLNAGLLTLGVKFKFHQDRISEIKNRQILEEIAAAILGGSCRILCEINTPKPKEKKPVADDELQKVAEQVFEVAS
jgi:DNA polymerase-3 subunit gamma/tau